MAGHSHWRFVISKVSTVIENKWPARMRRKMASDYLLAEHGVQLSPATMAKQAVVGGGCPYRRDGRYPVYDRVDLDAYAVERLGPLRRSTSDNGQKMAA